MKLKFLPIALLALSFTACDTYEESDDVAKQRAEQEALVKAENIKEAYNEYSQAYSSWNTVSNDIRNTQVNLQTNKDNLTLLEIGFDEAAVKAMKESDKAEAEAELTVAKARLEVLETAGVDVEALRTEIEAKEKEILALGDNKYTEIFNAARTALYAWNTTYNGDYYSAVVTGKGIDVAVWEDHSAVVKDNLSIIIETKKKNLDMFTQFLADTKEDYDAAFEAYTEAKTARDEAKADKDAAQVVYDAAKAVVDAATETLADANTAVSDANTAVTEANTAVTEANTAEATAQAAYDADDSDENLATLNSAKADVTAAEEAVVAAEAVVVAAEADVVAAEAALTEANADLNEPNLELIDAIMAFNIANSDYDAAQGFYEFKTNDYKSIQYSHAAQNDDYNDAVKALADFDVEALKAELTELNATYVAAFGVKEQIVVLSAEINELENTMFFFEANFDNVSNMETYLTSNISYLESSIENLEENIADLDEDLAEIAAGVYEMAELKDQYGRTIGELSAANLQEQITSLEAKLVESNELLVAAKAQLDAAKAAYEAFLAQ